MAKTIPSKRLTPKQARFVKNFKDNLGNTKKPETLGKMLINAGYSEHTANTPQFVMESPTIKFALQDYIKDLNDKRKLAITKMTAKKLEKSSAYQLAVIGDILTKNVQLLTGNETERHGITVEISEVIARKYQLQKAVEVQEANKIADNSE